MLEETEVAMEAARKSGAMIMKNFGKARVWDKGGEQLVTEADIRSEKIIMDTIHEKFPDHAFVSEEKGGSPGEEYWLIDPIDGTHNYAFGIPFFNVCLGFMDTAGTRNCVVYDPVRDVMYHAERGKGAYMNNDRMKVSEKSKIQDCIAGMPSQKVHQNPAVLALMKEFKEIRSFGAFALSTAYIAAGSIDVNMLSKRGGKNWIWFEYPATLMVTEAGGKVTDWDGNPAGPETSAVITGGKVHEQVLNLLRSGK